MKILILTGIKPNKQNQGGPSGLIWEIINTISQYIEVEIKYIETKNSLNKLGIYKKNEDINYSDFDTIFVYPFNLVFLVDKIYLNKTIVLGPDSPSLLFARFFKYSNGLSKIKNYILMKWFLYKEQKILKNIKKYLIVGKNDLRWLNLKHKTFNYKNHYLTHPILSDIIENNSCKYYNLNNNNKILIFSGDMSEKYTGNLIYEITNILNKDENTIFSILIVGKNNKWLYDYFISNINYSIQIEYIEWIENYNAICNPKQHIHVIPLQCGAGTKNRTLTACAKNLCIVSTFIGLENIYYNKPKNKIFKFKNSLDFYNILQQLNKFDLDNKIDNGFFVKNTNIKFKKEILKCLGIKNDNS